MCMVMVNFHRMVSYKYLLIVRKSRNDSLLLILLEFQPRAKIKTHRQNC